MQSCESPSPPSIQVNSGCFLRLVRTSNRHKPKPASCFNSMKTSLLILLLVVSLSHADQKEKKDNGITQRDAHLWEIYKNSPTQESLHNALKKIAYLDSRIRMLGWILFGVRKHQSVLRSVRAKNLPFGQCQKSTMKLFEKHCGAVTEPRMKQSLANICNYVSDKAAIEDAIILVCVMHTTYSHGVPAPIHGTSQHVDGGILRLVKWFMHVLELACIYMSSMGTPLYMLAVGSCFALSYVITSIIAPIIYKKTKLQPQNRLGQGDGGSTGSQKRNIIEFQNQKHEEQPKLSPRELAETSPKFEEWVIKNAHRIKLRPKDE